MLMNCTSTSGCNASEITDATVYAASNTLPDGLQADQASSGNLLLGYLFSTNNGYQYYPQLSQRQDFFQALQNVEQSKGGQVVWPQVAANVSSSLETVNSHLHQLRRCLAVGQSSGNYYHAEGMAGISVAL